MSQFVEIILDKPLRKSFQYKVPPHLQAEIKKGHFVYVPFGPKLKEIGCVVDLSNEANYDVSKLKEIIHIVNKQIQIPQILLDITKWIAEYYFCSWGEALFNTTPSTIRKAKIKYQKYVKYDPTLNTEISSPKQQELLDFLKKHSGFHEIKSLISQNNFSASSLKLLINKNQLHTEELEEGFTEDHIEESDFESKQINLNEEQTLAKNQIVASFHSPESKTFLLHGVTGSGKTEVYLEAIESCLKLGKKAIMLVPEIALTPQTVARFKQKFQHIAIMHSSLASGQRLSEWRRIQDGLVDVVVGARSAIFAPMPNVGIIIVDEEHEQSYKQDRTPRYNGRDLAVLRAKKENAVVVLGSATPSIESWHNVILKKYQRLSLAYRANMANLPQSVVLDLKTELQKNRNYEIFSSFMLDQLKSNLKAGLQSLVFINRKGYFPILMCKDCGENIKCINCDITLTMYKSTNKASCNHCGYTIQTPKSCPKCHSENIRYKGFGTERVTEVLQALIPSARILRMDAKTMTNNQKHEEAYRAFKNHEFDILVGTQMVSKGLDFSKLTLVGILQIDSSLGFLDFRMAEKTFQLISQVSGRAGRSSYPGVVVLQTFSPEHFVVKYATQNDYRSFAKKELENRQMLHYPPFSKLGKLLLKSQSETKLNDFVNHLAPILKSFASTYDVTCLGPAPAGIEKLEKEYRIQFLIKASSHQKRHSFFTKALETIKPPNQISLIIDIDPTNTL